MKRWLQWALAGVMACGMCLVMNLDAYAYDSNLFVPWQGGYYAVKGSESASAGEAYLKGQLLIGRQYKEFGTLADYSTLILQDGSGAYRLGFAQADADRMTSAHAQCQAWCAVAVPVIVPQGTSRADALVLIANWVADYMSYDNAAATNVALATYYQSMMPGLVTGKGVCATYATMFDTMVSWLPFNAATWRVDYATKSPAHVDTLYVMNADHGWSAVRLGNAWAMYDITFYDNSNGARQVQYLNMSAAILNDKDHIGVQSLLY